MILDEKAVIDYYAKRLNKTKYEIMLRTEDGIQVKKLKQVNKLGIWIGLLLLPFWGIGFILWILTLLDYVLQHEKVTFITIDQMVRQMKEAK